MESPLFPAVLGVVALVLLAAVVVMILAAVRAWALGKGTGFGKPSFWHSTSDAGVSPPLDMQGTALPQTNPTSPHHDGGFNNSTNAPSFEGGHAGVGDFGGGSFGGGGDCGGGGGGGDGGASCG